MKRKLLLVLATIIMAGCVPSISAQEPTPEHFVYLPYISNSVDPLATPTATPRPTDSPTSTPTSTPTPTTTPAPIFTPTITPTPTNTPTLTPLPVYDLLNGDFENGQDGSWTEQLGDSPRWWWSLPWRPLVNTFTVRMGEPYLPGHGSWLGWLGAADADPQTGGWEATTAIEQLVTVPQGMDLCFEYLIYSEDYWDNRGDAAKLLFDSTILVSWDVIGSNSSAYWGEWHDVCIDLEGWWGDTVMLRFEMTNDHVWYGDFHIDNVEFRPTD